MNKTELEQYARDNCKRLNAQEVRLGDVVRVLRGRFAGIKGVIVGIQALSVLAIDDTYFEVSLDCDVPEQYRCRSSLLPQGKLGNISGGFNKCDFEVINNDTEDSE